VENRNSPLRGGKWQLQTLLTQPAMKHKNLLKLSHAMLTSAANKHYSKTQKKRK